MQRALRQVSRRFVYELADGVLGSFVAIACFLDRMHELPWSRIKSRIGGLPRTGLTALRPTPCGGALPASFHYPSNGQVHTCPKRSQMV